MSGIFVKGMEMPDACISCDWKERCLYADTCKKMYGDYLSSGRDKNCFMKSIDELIEKIKEKEEIEAVGGVDHMAKVAFNTGLHTAIQVIKEYCEVENADS